MKNWSLYQLLFWVCIVAACEKPAINATSSSLNRLVVEGYLQPGAPPLVQIKKQILYGSTDSIQAPVDGLEVFIEDLQTGEIHFMQQGDSTAYTGSGWTAESEKSYRLSFEYEGVEVLAETRIPEKPLNFNASASTIQPFVFSFPPSFPDPVELKWEASEGGYYLIVVVCIENNPVLINSDIEFTPPFTFRTEPEQINSYSLQATSFEYYGRHQVILYHLNAEYAALYENTGNNSTNLTTPYTNIMGGLGIFTGVNADTLMIKVQD